MRHLVDSPNSKPASGRFASPVILLLVALLVVSSTGCMGYRIGTLSLYPEGIQTVYVPIFESRSFRRGLGERLTEAVQKQIEKETPYRVVGTPDLADTILTGKIIGDTKRVTAGSKSGYPRGLQVKLIVECQWVDRSSRQGIGSCGPEGIMPQCNMLLDPSVSADSMVVPQVGQSIATGYQDTIEKVAEQIVSNMQVPW